MFFTAWMGFEDGSSSCLVLLKSRSRSLSGGFSMPRWCVLRARRRYLDLSSLHFNFGFLRWSCVECYVGGLSTLSCGYSGGSVRSEIVILLGGLDEWVTRKL
ncbi:hypothetical protein F2Q69_00009256 [Brassica cretica]|uniref:Uncharacterized protein n=1 Tax=Brassica cretica TaxID=69181 RepID=A0A8S9P3G6_BRACR|nr:hypothetical protein F2Q69_00009256 [Brassica cretica]